MQLATISRFPFPAYPNGWFAVGFSSDFAVDKVVTRKLLGQELVVYRSGSGALHVTEAYCPHIGAHLGFGGRVEGENIRCPFHGWCFDGAGECIDVPGASKIPPRARLKVFHVREQNGVAFIYHHAGQHAEDAAPTWEPPVLPMDEWSADRTILWNVRTHPQEVFENVVDKAHLPPVHGVQRAAFESDPTEDGPQLHVAINLIADGAIIGMPGMLNDVVLDVRMHGLGMAVVHTHVRNAGVTARQRIYCTPIDGERTEIRGAVSVQKTPDDAVTNVIAELFYQAYVIDFAMDFPIWENKIYREKALVSSADGPFAWYRKWARQFYGTST